MPWTPNFAYKRTPELQKAREENFMAAVDRDGSIRAEIARDKAEKEEEERKHNMTPKQWQAEVEGKERDREARYALVRAKAIAERDAAAAPCWTSSEPDGDGVKAWKHTDGRFAWGTGEMGMTPPDGGPKCPGSGGRRRRVRGGGPSGVKPLPAAGRRRKTRRRHPRRKTSRRKQ